jgi:hypothetical protein
LHEIPSCVAAIQAVDQGQQILSDAWRAASASARSPVSAADFSFAPA